MADSPMTEIPSVQQDFYHVSTSLKATKDTDLTVISSPLCCDEADKSVVCSSLMRGTPGMQRMSSD